MKKVSEVMTRDIRVASPDQTIAEVAAEMARSDIGCLPVGDKDKLVGMVSDRDIVLRAVAKGLDAGTRVSAVMTESIRYCYDDQSIDEVARNMAELGVRRMPVVDRDKRLVGVIALSNIAQGGGDGARDTFLAGVATPH